MHTRTVFVISDGTGITAETFGTALMAQFDITPRIVRIPFVDTVDKAHQAVRQINHSGEVEGKNPIVFSTLVNPDVVAVVTQHCKGLLMDMFGTFVQPLEDELGLKSQHRVGRFSDISQSKEYLNRMEAINYTLAHDDGQTHADLSGADVVLIGVSRSGKTPTSLYLAMQFGLTIDPQRLSDIRNERRPNSRYASLQNCRHEVAEAEAMMRRAGVQWLSSTHKSIEEISTTVLQQVLPQRLGVNLHG